MYTNEDKINHALILYLHVSSAITFANSLDPDQARQMSGLTWIQTVCLKEFLITLTANRLDPDQAQQMSGMTWIQTVCLKEFLISLTANSLDPDQAQQMSGMTWIQTVCLKEFDILNSKQFGPDPNCFDTDGIPERI